MKTKRLFFLAAMLLMSVCGFAQSGGGDPIPGDVNGDGVVDVGDIVAVINGAATGDVNNDGNVDGDDIVAVIDIIQSNTPITYYWYVGQTNPSSMSEISPIVSDMSSPGWRLIGNTLPTYSSSNKLYDATDPNSLIITGTSLATQWVAIPASSSACVRDGAGNDGSTVNICTRKDNQVLGGVEYKVYEWNSKAKKLGYDIY